MDRLENRTTLRDNQRFFADENGDVYVLSLDISRYGYTVSKMIEVGKNATETHEVKNPTKEQKLYALLNYVFLDNQRSVDKTGIYNLSDDQIYDAFEHFMLDLSSKNMTTKEVFARFGLNPSGEWEQGATNGIIRDIIIEYGRHEKAEDLDYVFRSETPVSYFGLERAEDGNVYVAEPDYAGSYGHNICRLLPNNKSVVIKNPTSAQRENALLNLIVADNISNPSKTGIYSRDIEQIEHAFAHTMYDAENGKCKTSDVLRRFGVDFSGELMSTLAYDLTSDVIADRIKKVEDCEM